MRVMNENGAPVVSAERYTLAFAVDRPFVHLGDADGNPVADLFYLSSIHPLHNRDDTIRTATWEVATCEDGFVLSLQAESSVWRQKEYRFRCYPQRFTYEMEVVGEGSLAEVHPFGGYYSGNLRWGSGFFPSGQFFQQGFNPQPNQDELNHFSPAEGSSINLTGVPLPGRGSWFFTPTPFCFAFQSASGWMSMGIEAAPGANRFTEYRYVGQHDSFQLRLAYEGHTAVCGHYRLPAIGFDFAGDEYQALAAHVQVLRRLGYTPEPDPGEKPAWWFEPIFCGWGAQSYLARLERGRAADFARQALYEEFIRALEAHEISPGIVVVDDKWQTTYGNNQADLTKWPDLRGFVEEQHQAGRKVLLWLKAWDPEGVPAEECITNAAGSPIAVDPTHPAFEGRLRRSIRQMLSCGGYDADGFKIDFPARIPSGPAIWPHGDLWGLELMKCYFGIIYGEAKQVKSDALIMSHTPHPYLADVVDMIRLNDINRERDIPKEMTHRARVASIACPHAVIDTDNWPITDRAAFRTYLSVQGELGVPSLYYISHVDTTGEPLEAEDYRLIREAWAAYRSRRKHKQAA